jgi:hypothetical protein
VESNDWVTLLLVGCLLFLTLAKYLYPKRFQEFVQLPLTNKYFSLQGKNDTVEHPFNVLLFIPQAISVSLLIYLSLKTLYPSFVTVNPWLYVQLLGGYTVFVLAKYYIEKIVANVFSIDGLINNYLYQKLSYRNFLAILVFVANLLFVYVVSPSPTVLVLAVIFLVLLNGIALLYSYKKNTSVIFSHFFYFILYLCALEISPYIILYKTLV